MQAFGGIPTGETFDQWIVSPGGTSATHNVLTTPATSTGLAVAAYKPTAISPPTQPPLIVPEGAMLRFLGGDPILVVGPGGQPMPVGPPPFRDLVLRMLAAT